MSLGLTYKYYYVEKYIINKDLMYGSENSTQKSYNNL